TFDGSVTLNSLFKTFSIILYECFESVVVRNFLPNLLRRLICFIYLATVTLETSIPFACKSIVILGLPYRCFLLGFYFFLDRNSLEFSTRNTAAFPIIIAS